MISKRRAFIVGIKGYKLTNKEISFLRKYRPWGIILFTRNIKSIEQTRLLTEKIKSIFKDKNFPLEIAEIELTNEKEEVILPPFLSREITDLKIFSNFSLTKNPFSKWKSKNF